MPHRVTRREFIGTAVATTAIVGTSRIAQARTTFERVRQQYVAWNAQMLPMPEPS